MRSKHTPKTWHVSPRDERAVVIEDHRGHTITIANAVDCPEHEHGPEYGDYDGQIAANARLIAAAPDMLEALKFVQMFTATVETSPRWDANSREVIRPFHERVQEAIAKAGGAP